MALFRTLILALALTGAFLAGPARARMDSWTAGVTLLHLALGTLLAPLGLIWAGSAVRRVCARGSKAPARRMTSRSVPDGGPLRRLPRRAPEGEAGFDTDLQSNPAPPSGSSLLSAAGCLLAAAFLTGIALVIAAARGSAAPERVLGIHQAAGGLVLVAVAARWFVRRRPLWAPRSLSVPPAARLLPPVTGTLLAALVVLGLLAGAAAMPRSQAPADVGAGTHYQPEQYYADLTATNARQASNPLFPACTTVRIEPGGQIRPAAYCGEAGCHPGAYQEWLGSAHRRAGTDPCYLEAAALFAAQRGATARRWCEGCHAPVAMAGQVLGVQVFRCSGVQARLFQSLNTRTPEHLNTSPDGEGVNCLTCHAVTRVTELSGNGRLELRVPSDYPFADSTDPGRRWLHAFLLRLRPGPHRQAFLNPLLGQSEFCASCHRMSYNLPQNQYKFLRTEDDYGTWQAGPDSAQSIHTFAPPGPLRRCQDCHDAHRGGVQAFGPSGVQAHSTHVLAQRPNARTPERLKAPAVTVDLLALRREPRTPGAPEELIAPLDEAQPRLRPGEAVTVDVVVRNRAMGHEFPAGVGNEGAWLELAVTDPRGRLLLRSGGISPDGSIDPGAHTYGMIGLDRHGCRLRRGDLWNMVTPLYQRTLLPGQPDTDRRTIQPGESDVVHYRVRVPMGAPGPLTLRARLWCRKAVARRQTPDAIPAKSGLTHAGVGGAGDGRLTAGDRMVAEDSVTLPLSAAAAPTPRPRCTSGHRVPAAEVLVRSSGRVLAKRVMVIRSGTREAGDGHPSLPDRFYDYGVGLLLQGDLPRAQQAMRRVQAQAPRDDRGYLGLGRVYLTEGDLLAARAQFEQARRRAPDDPRPRAFLAATERRMGQYDAALALLQPLVRDYPRDRSLWFDLGMCHYLSGRYQEASRAFLRMLDIDPDDLAAHYNLMRCLRSLHRLSEARREAVIYQTLREDDNARQIALSYLHTHPLADRETRSVHEHPLAPVTSNG